MALKHTKYFVFPAILLLVAISVLIYYSIAPDNFPTGVIFSVERNSGVSKIAGLLAARGIVKSAFLFKVYVSLLHDGKGIQAGDYLFDTPQSVLKVAYRIAYGDQDLPQIKITVPEGLTASDIGRLLAKNISEFDAKAFSSLAKPQEGYLFPNTYYFYRNTTANQAVKAMRDNFDKQTARLKIPSVISPKSFNDIVIMASIVEKEATSTVDRKTIAGILWKRIAAGMPLQVDPPFFYILGKTSSELTLDDLNVDSPYNLYLNKGLPPTPIDNPGLDALTAVLSPISSKYWFYLSDSKGNMHYAETHDGHLANKQRYLQ